MAPAKQLGSGRPPDEAAGPLHPPQQVDGAPQAPAPRAARERRLPGKLQQCDLSTGRIAQPAGAVKPRAAARQPARGVAKPTGRKQQQPAASSAASRRSSTPQPRGSKQQPCARSTGRERRLPLKLHTAEPQPQPQKGPVVRLARLPAAPQPGKRKRQPSVRLEDSVLQLGPPRASPAPPAKRAKAAQPVRRERQGPQQETRQPAPIVLRLKPHQQQPPEAQPAPQPLPVAEPQPPPVADPQPSLEPSPPAEEPLKAEAKESGQPTLDPAGSEQQQLSVSESLEASPWKHGITERPEGSIPGPVQTLQLKLSSRAGAAAPAQPAGRRQQPLHRAAAAPSRRALRRSQQQPQARRALFRSCKAPVSLADSDCCTDSGSESEAEAPALPFTMRTRFAAVKRTAGRQGPAGPATGEDLAGQCSANSGPEESESLQEESESLHEASDTDSAATEAAAAAAPAALGSDAAEVQATAESGGTPEGQAKQTAASEVPGPETPKAAAPAAAAPAKASTLAASVAAAPAKAAAAAKTPKAAGFRARFARAAGAAALQPLHFMARKPAPKRPLPAAVAVKAQPPAKRRATCPPGSLQRTLGAQLRLFPELPPKLVAPTQQLFSLLPVTRTAPGEALPTGRPAPPTTPKGMRTGPKALGPARPPGLAGKRLQPAGLLKQARAVAVRPKPAAAQGVPPGAAAAGLGGCSSLLGALQTAAIAGTCVCMDSIRGLLEAAPAAEQPQLWRDVQTVLLQHSVQQLLRGLRTTPLPSASQAKLTAGVSYVLRSSSRQVGVADRMAPLPHTVIRPPVAASPPSPRVQQLLAVLESQPVAAAVLPLRDDAQAKQYLLEAARRPELLAAAAGQLRTVPGATALHELLADRSFVCLHYQLDAAGALRPCRHGPEGPGIAASNVQIGLTVRRGVGGTCPARNAGRKLAAQGLLPALLDQQMPIAEAQLPEQPDSPAAAAVQLQSQQQPAASAPLDAGKAAQASAVDGLAAATAQGLQQPAQSQPAPAPAAAGARLPQASGGQAAAASQQPQRPAQPLSAAAQAQPSSGQAQAQAAGTLQPGAQQPAQPATPQVQGQALRRRQPARPEAAEWLLGEEEGVEELLQEMDSLLEDSSDPDYAPGDAAKGGSASSSSGSSGGGSSSSSSSSDSPRKAAVKEGEEAGAARQKAARMLAAGALTGHPRLRLYTRSCRLELYASLELWQALTSQQRSDLAGAVRELELSLGRQQLRWNHASLLAFAERLQAEVGSAALASPLAAALLRGHKEPRVRLELRVSEGAEQPVAVRLVCIDPQPEPAAAPAPMEVGCEVAAVCRSLVDAVCGNSEPDPATEVAAVLSGLLDSVCGAAAAGGGGGSGGSSGSRTPEEDAALQAEHTGLFALASAVATAHTGRAAHPDFPWPFYFIGTRDCFTYDLVARSEEVTASGRRFRRQRYFFPPGQAPADYHAVVQPPPKDAAGSPAERCADGEELLPTGITTYTELYSEEEMRGIEAAANSVDAAARGGELPPACFHTTQNRSGHLKRTKLFFGARYLWTHEQLATGAQRIAGGVRVDVPPPRTWMKARVEQPLVQAGLLAPGFVDSWALNLYHDGSEGIQSHFDDAARFERPITSLRLMSDSRLSFGTQLYGYTNGAFCVDMPRGCVTVMEQGGYAATGLKHCVRPVDMAGRSAALIMRKIRPEAMAGARQLALDEAGEWLAALALREGATPPSLLARTRADAAARERQDAAVQREVWRVLDTCLRSLEAANRPPQARRPALKLTLPVPAPPPSLPPQLRPLALLVSQVEQLAEAEMRKAGEAVREVQAVMERCLAGLDPSAGALPPFQAADGSSLPPLAPQPPAGCQQLLQAARQLRQQLSAPQPLAPLPTLQLQPPAGPVSVPLPQLPAQQSGLQPAVPAPGLAASPPACAVPAAVQAPQSLAGALQSPAASAAAVQPPLPPGVGGLAAPSWLFSVLAACQAVAAAPQLPPASPPSVRAALAVELRGGQEAVRLSLCCTGPASQPALKPALPATSVSLPPLLAWPSPAQLAPQVGALVAGLRTVLGSSAQQPLPASQPALAVLSRQPAASAPPCSPPAAQAAAAAAQSSTAQALPATSPGVRPHGSVSAEHGVAAAAAAHGVSWQAELADAAADAAAATKQSASSVPQVAQPAQLSVPAGSSTSRPASVASAAPQPQGQALPLPQAAGLAGSLPTPATSLAFLQTELSGLVTRMQTQAAAAAQQQALREPPTPPSRHRALAKPAARAAARLPPMLRLAPGPAPAPPAAPVRRAPAVPPAAPKTPRRPKPAAAAGNQGACWRCFTATPVCPPKGSREGGVWSCGGACRRTFHEACQKPDERRGQLLCVACSRDWRMCAACGKPGTGPAGLRKCSMSKCSHFFHTACAAGMPGLRANPASASFRCPQHYCASCGESGDAVAMVHCIRCTTGYHCRCKPEGCRQLTKKLIVCGKHT